MFEPLIEGRRAGEGEIGLSQAGRDVGLKLRFGDALFLEIELIEKAVLVHGLGHFDKRHFSPRGVWNT